MGFNLLSSTKIGMSDKSQNVTNKHFFFYKYVVILSMNYLAENYMRKLVFGVLFSLIISIEERPIEDAKI